MKIFTLVLAVFVAAALSFYVPQPVQADLADEACKGATGANATAECEGTGFTDGFKNIVNVVIFMVGAVAVLMIIIGGFRYVVSGGDSAGVEGAKNTILYAVIGVVVAFLAYAIVNFVIGGVGQGGTGSGSGSGSGSSLNPPTSTPSSGP
jgi:hypothetical protein